MSDAGLVAPFSDVIISLRTVLTWKPGHYFCELLFLADTGPCVRGSLRWLLEEFLVKVHTNPEVDAPFAPGNLELFLRAPCIWQSLAPDASV